jgi:hypothetical protein
MPLLFTLSFHMAFKRFQLLPSPSSGAGEPATAGHVTAEAAAVPQLHVRKKRFWSSLFSGVGSASRSSSNGGASGVSSGGGAAAAAALALPPGFFDVPAEYTRADPTQSERQLLF